MCAQIIDGKSISGTIKDELKLEVARLNERGIQPTLAVVLVGEDAASQVYVRNKKLACQYVGIKSLAYELSKDTTEEELLHLVQQLNNNAEVHGILVQLPLPKHINEDHILLAIDPKKDVDGFHPMNVGNLSIGREGFVSCTPAGIIELLKRSNINLQGKKCVVIGRSNIVGKPIAMLLLRENATVTICHSKTVGLEEECRQADVLIAAIGKAEFVGKNFVKEGA
ncbi:MAG: bifunctional methylenetetrahydrofolate dehydrogenase/methenyltetrahydrofolate cyclohydrolase, partial [Vallitaleaceae bacterium]|nr:bifunctional methylenetetrahydrofolate dehydrogenase/methenyltetrahydrofolate cyclohydrolase [Vallitaleaceae bacterium]